MAETIVPQKIFDGNGGSKQEASSLWAAWWSAILLLQPAFSYLRAFMWFAAVVAGLTIRPEMLGVSSIVRTLKLKSCFYSALLRNFHSNAVGLDELSALWARIVLRLFPAPLRINGRLVIVGDGIKVAKRGKKMPGVKLLHQQSENKAEFIMGHSMQAVSLLVRAGKSVAAVTLAMRIHEGIIFSNRYKKTLLDKMLTLLGIVNGDEPFYFIGDAYYAAHTIIVGLLKLGSHLITRVKSNAVAYVPYLHEGPRKRGRPRVYGEKIVLASLFKNRKEMRQTTSPVYGEQNITLQYIVRDLVWRQVGYVVRFVAVMHPTRGSCLLMSTDTALDPVEIIRLYGLRFKIEYSFKQAVHQIGSFTYHFWMKQMVPQRQGDGNQYLHRKPIEYREGVKRKLHAYHVFIQAGVISQGLLQYLSIAFPQLVWHSFGSWLRTIRPGIAPSEFVVAEALRQSFPYFLLTSADHHAFAKFITQRQDVEKMQMFRMAA
jgi:DDE superfamily endonuclease